MSDSWEERMQRVNDAEIALARNWNVPVGTEVDVAMDDGTVRRTTVLSVPWMVGGTAVIKLDGISGGYRLTRVTVAG